MPRRTVRKLDRFVRSRERRVEWRRGDVLLVDNTRFMHGREPVECNKRLLLTRFGYTDWHQGNATK